MYTVVMILKLDDEALTLKARLVDTAETAGAWITTGFTELQNAEYQLILTVPDAFRGRLEIYTDADVYITSTSINPEEFEYNVPRTPRNLIINQREIRA